MRSTITKLAIGLLVISTLAALAFVARLSWDIYAPGGWRDEMYGQVGMNASNRALTHFRRRHLRLYELRGESEDERFTGKMDGAFEIWTPHFYPSLGRAHLYATECFIEFYNRKMRYMHSRPEKFLREEQVTPPNGTERAAPVVP